MTSRLNEGFVDHYARLPAQVRRRARRSYALWRENPWHPSLHFRRVHEVEPIWSVRIGIGWRALGYREGDVVTWFWIGSHAEYDHLLAQL